MRSMMTLTTEKCLMWTRHTNIIRLQKVSWPTQGSSCAFNIYLMFSSSIEMFNLFFKVSTVPVLTTCLLSFFQSSTTLLVNQFLPISFPYLNLSSLKPFVRVHTFSMTMRTLPISPLLKPLIYLNISNTCPLTQGEICTMHCDKR